MTEISQYTNQILVSFLRDIEKENSEPIFQISDALPMFFYHSDKATQKFGPNCAHEKRPG